MIFEEQGQWCKGFYCKKQFHRHTLLCTQGSPIPVHAIPPTNTVDEFTRDIISREDMFLRRNFTMLEGAIDRVPPESSTSLKHGVTNGLCYVLKNSATILMASYLGEDNDAKAAEVQNSVHYLELNRVAVFADAVYAINKSRQERLRMPE